MQRLYNSVTTRAKGECLNFREVLKGKLYKMLTPLLHR